MVTLVNSVGLSFDDIVVVPQFSSIPTRKVVDLSTKLGTLELQIPLISANMDSITGVDMALAMSKLGGLGILHRYQTPAKTIEDICLIKSHNQKAVPSIGIQEKDKELILAYKDAGADAICIDVAHGDHRGCYEMTSLAAKHFDTVIAGNIISRKAAKTLYDSGARVAKIGVGNGSMCSTRVVTGHGMPQVSALLDVCSLRDSVPNLHIISDGGIRTSGDCVKAIACGANAIMSGSLFAGCVETPTFEGLKIYRGMASRQAREQFYGNHDAVPEGESVTSVPRKGAVSSIIEHLMGGIRSGLSYSGCINIEEFQEAAVLMQVTQSAHIEGTPHFLSRV